MLHNFASGGKKVWLWKVYKLLQISNTPSWVQIWFTAYNLRNITKK